MNSQNELLVTLILSDSLFMKYMYDLKKREKVTFMDIFFFYKVEICKINKPVFL